MKSDKLRKKFLSFYKEKGHKIVESSSLIPEDGSVLFTTAGMQQFKPFYVKGDSPYGTRVASTQKCFRTSDIEEVGDQDHLTFFEMLGNFSFGDYFKEEAILWAKEFLVEELDLDEENLVYTYFKGSENTPEDKKAKEILLESGVPEEKIYALSKEENFWGPTGTEGPCGPTVEIHYVLKDEACGPDCDPSCDCDKFIEIWNLVFNQFYMDEDKNLEPLEHQGIDTGMGLERLAMVVQGKPHVFETDLFTPLKEKIDQLSSQDINQRAKRIIADHIKGSVFLIAENVTPSNTERGYILRRLLRRAMRYRKLLDLPENALEEVAKVVFDIYGDFYLQDIDKEQVFSVIEKERKKFEKALDKGLKEFEKVVEKGSLDGKKAFHLYSTYGFPLEMIEELCEEEEIDFTREGFEKAKKEHIKASKKGAEEKFGGVSKDPEKQEVKLHSATHLLHESLRRVLGNHVKQEGSDINPKRLRFDFSHPEKMTDEELEKVENLVNKKIEEGLKREVEEMPYDQAVEKGALSFFDKDRYPEIVKVYSFVNEDGQAFSKELCGGPHVKNTKQLGKFKIKKEKSSSRGVRRIKAVLN
ncbi:MAG: alanine--tRNA ligase [Patescibacteria group bacterium]